MNRLTPGYVVWLLLGCFRTAGFAAFAIWAVHSEKIRISRERLLLAGFMVLGGGFDSLRHMVWLCGPGIADCGPWTRYPSVMYLYYYLNAHAEALGGLLGALMVLICGIIIAVRPNAAKSTAVYFLLASLLSIVGWAWERSIWRYNIGLYEILYYWVSRLATFVLAVLFMLFVYRRFDVFMGEHPHCKRCGYDLTGNVSGVCSECGAAVPGSGGGAE